MAPTVASREPERMVAGDTLKWTRSLSDFPAGDGWVVTYELRNATNAYSFTASASGDDHAVNVAAATTALWAAGTYDLAGYATLAGERYEIYRGRLEVRANLALSGATDSRSHARKVLDAIEATIEGRATADHASYTIAGRSITKIPVGELLLLRDRYKAEVERERAAARIEQGLPGRRRVLTRFA